MKNKAGAGDLRVIIVVILLGLAIYYGVASSGSISGWGTDETVIRGDTITLITTRIKGIGIDGCFDVNGIDVDKSSKGWVRDRVSRGMELSCLFKHRPGTASISNSADGSIRCCNIDTPIDDAKKDQWYVGTQISWTFSEPQPEPIEPVIDEDGEPIEEVIEEIPEEIIEIIPNECVANVDCIENCAGDVPTCSDNKCYCDGSFEFIDEDTGTVYRDELGLWERFLAWLRGLFE